MEVKKIRGEYVLIEPDIKDEITPGGIIIAKNPAVTFNPQQSDFFVGIIKKVGTGKRVEGPDGYGRLDLEVGDKVIFRYGTKINIGGDTSLLLVNEQDIVIILE